MNDNYSRAVTGERGVAGRHRGTGELLPSPSFMATTNGTATNPQSQAQVNGIVEQDVAKNRVPVHTFDPDASPQEKGAAAGKDKEKLKLNNANGDARGKELSLDTGKANIVPTITVEDVDKNRVKAQQIPDQKTPPSPTLLTSPPSPKSPNGPTSPTSSTSAISPVSPGSPTSPVSPTPPSDLEMPGAMPSGPAPTIPDWYKVGWRSVSGIDTPILSEGEERDKLVLSMFLKEQYYGEWYHNAALIFVTVIATHFLTRFHLGWGWLFVLLAFCSTYYTTSMTRTRRRARDDIQRELVKTRLDSDDESADWINNFLDRFWLIYEPVLAQTIIASVDQVLSTNCPSFLDSLRMSTFTLGTKAPRIERVKTSPRTDDDVVLMEWQISFTPNDTSEMTEKQKLDKVNPKIVLSVRVGKGVASAVIPILVEDLSFSGHLKIRLKLMTTFPHVQLVDLSFMEKPVFDYVLKPIGGETFGFDIGFVPGLSAFIRDMIHATLQPMMYDPNVFTLNLEQLLSGEPLDTAVGVLQVTIHSARGLKGVKLGGGTPDPFVSLSINQRAELARTKYKHNTPNPTWMETKFLVVNSLTESLIFSVLDYNEHRKHTELGQAIFDMNVLQEDATQESLEARILKDGKERGIMRFDVNFFPVLKPELDQGGKERLPDGKVGIVRLTIHQAKDLDHTKSLTGDLSPFVKVFLGAATHATHVTRKVKHTHNPVWESSTEFLCTDKASSVIIAKVIDDRDFVKDPILGYMSIRLQDLLKARESGKDWWPLSGCKSGKIRVTAEWKPLNMAGSLHGVDQYVPPIGVVRLWLQKATDVKNVEATLGGKSDPYVRAQINNITQGRTEVVNNNLNPQWDQIIYIPVHSLKETMMLECMDYQHLTKDRSLGYVELKVSDLAQPSDGEFLYASTGKKEAAEPLRLDKGTFKGQLHYVAEFIPAYTLKGITFNTGPNELQRAVVPRSESDDGETVVDMEEETNMGVPEGITVAKPVDAEGKAEEQSNGENGHKKTNSSATSLSGVTAKTSNGETSSVNEKHAEDRAVEMSKDELLTHQSGVLIFNVISGQLHKKARLEVLLDDGYWPAFNTPRARSTNAVWEYIDEGFMKELDFGRVWLRLNEADEGDKDDIIAEWKGDAKPFLEKALDGPIDITLVDQDDEDKKSVVQIEARYIPVPIKLEPRESVNNQGMLRVDLLDGNGIHAVDRGGKSDPFVVFTLNGQKVYKSQTKKKTLSPEWNEDFIVQVPSRVGADFALEVFDWNQIEQAKSLGAGQIEVSDLEPFSATERTISLSSAKHGDKGAIRLRLLFTPEIIVRSRKNTSTFTSAGRAMTQIGHLPVGAGKGVLSGVTGVFKKDYAKHNGSVDSQVDAPSTIEPPAGQVSHPIFTTTPEGAPAVPSMPSVPHDMASQGQSQDLGTLRVGVLDAKDLSINDSKPYVVLRVGDKEQKTKHVSSKASTPEWNETFAFSAAPATQPKMFVWVFDHKTLGKDKVLGSAEIDIWRHVQAGHGVSASDVAIELREGQGLLHLRLEFDPDTPLTRSRSRSSFHSGERTAPTSPSRFSLSLRRDRTD